MPYGIDGIDLARVAAAPRGLQVYSWRGCCRISGCSNAATSPHHVFPRGRTGGPVRYVLIDGEPWPNVLGLCARHHLRITEGTSVLIWQDEPERGWWYQSPVRTVRVRAFDHAGAMLERGGRCCALCGQGKPKPRPYELHRRQRRGYVISAPVDGGENGPEILASLAEQVADKIGLERPESDSAAYHAVVTSLTAVLLDDSALQGLRHHFHGEDR